MEEGHFLPFDYEPHRVHVFHVLGVVEGQGRTAEEPGRERGRGHHILIEFDDAVTYGGAEKLQSAPIKAEGGHLADEAGEAERAHQNVVGDHALPVRALACCHEPRPREHGLQEEEVRQRHIENFAFQYRIDHARREEPRGGHGRGSLSRGRGGGLRRRGALWPERAVRLDWATSNDAQFHPIGRFRECSRGLTNREREQATNTAVAPPTQIPDWRKRHTRMYRLRIDAHLGGSPEAMHASTTAARPARRRITPSHLAHGGCPGLATGVKVRIAETGDTPARARQQEGRPPAAPGAGRLFSRKRATQLSHRATRPHGQGTVRTGLRSRHPPTKTSRSSFQLTASVLWPSTGGPGPRRPHVHQTRRQ